MYSFHPTFLPPFLSSFPSFLHPFRPLIFLTSSIQSIIPLVHSFPPSCHFLADVCAPSLPSSPPFPYRSRQADTIPHTVHAKPERREGRRGVSAPPSTLPPLEWLCILPATCVHAPSRRLARVSSAMSRSGRRPTGESATHHPTNQPIHHRNIDTRLCGARQEQTRTNAAPAHLPGAYQTTRSMEHLREYAHQHSSTAAQQHIFEKSRTGIHQRGKDVNNVAHRHNSEKDVLTQQTSATQQLHPRRNKTQPHEVAATQQQNLGVATATNN